MKIVVCGGRDFGNLIPNTEKKKAEYEFILRELDKIAYARFPRTETDRYGNYLYDVKIISGGARGVDSVAIDWAVVNWCDFIEYKANWNKYGKNAGLIRNQEMLDKENPDLIIAFPGGRGTADMVRRSKEANIEVVEVKYIESIETGV